MLCNAAMLPVDDIRRQNLRHLVSEVQGVKRLADKVGVSESQMSQWLNGTANSATGKPRGMRPASCRRIETATQKPQGWMDVQHLHAGEEPATYLVSHGVSHQVDSDELPLLSWEAIMRIDTPAIFRALMSDDAMSPDFPAGTEVVWTTRRRAAPGRLLLVKDAHGQLHARMCHQGQEPGTWAAVASNPAYLSFSSTDAGLQLVAVYKGRLEPDDD